MSPLPLPLEKLPGQVNRLFVAFSSGIDSCVLLHKLVNQTKSYSIVLWHINHGLQPNADQMQQKACDYAARYNLKIRIDQLDLDPASGNLEALARQARYDLFSSALTPHDALLTAHHMDDQAETLMLNLMRGSGAAGLRAIAELTTLGNGYLFRPLLNYQRVEIEQYALQNALQWVDDPSNQSLDYDRNYLRHQIFPALKQRWPAVNQQLHRVSEWQREQVQLLTELAEQDLQSVLVDNAFSSYPCLSVNRLKQFSTARQKNLVRHWLASSQKPALGYKKLYQLLQQLSAKPDAQPVIEGQGFSVRSYDGLLFIVDDFSIPKLSSRHALTAGEVLIIEDLKINTSRESMLKYLELPDRGQRLEIGFRSGNQATDVLNKHRLKRLFQKHRVPPWLRDVTAQIYVDNELFELYLI